MTLLNRVILAFLAADIPDAMAAWVTFRDLCHDNYLDTVEAVNLIVFAGNLL